MQTNSSAKSEESVFEDISNLYQEGGGVIPPSHTEKIHENYLDLVKLQIDKVVGLVPCQEILRVETSQAPALQCLYKSGNRPCITLRPGEQHIAIDEAEDALLRGNMGIYQRSGKLVKIIHSKTSNSRSYIRRPDDALIIAEVDSIHLTELMGRVAIWQKNGTSEKGLKTIDGPERIAKMLLARGEWNFPVLFGVIQAPTLRPDGSILELPGYDEDTGLFFEPGISEKFPNVPEFPTVDEAKKALNILCNLIKDFPFEDDASRSVALSAILTALVRGSISTAPLHGFTAPKMGSGKSLLADVVGLIAIGKSNSVISQAENEAEEKKRLLAILLEGDSIICYDNIERPFESASLCSVLTEGFYKDRILGQTKSLGVRVTSTFLATGNNLTFHGDISTRTLLCKIDPRKEHPEQREFNINLREYIPENRGEIVQAGLTVLRAYHVAGRPKQDIKQFGRFEEWSNWIRSALVWLGREDPCKSREEIEHTDPIRLTLSNLLTAWFEVFGDIGYRAKDVVKRVFEGESDAHATLKEALIEFAADARGEISQRVLGNKLSSCKGRIENGLRLEISGQLQGTNLWRVKKI